MSLQIVEVPVSELKTSEYNPRKWSDSEFSTLEKSIKEFGFQDPIIVNCAENRKNVLIGGHFRLAVAKALGYKTVPVVYVNIPDVEKEKRLNLLLNNATGSWDYELLAKFDEKLLIDVGFSSEDLDDIFEVDINPEKFDLEKELKKLKIDKITVKKGDCYKLDGGCQLCCGDSTIEEDMIKLMDGNKADMCFTDPPYILNYNSGKRRSNPEAGFGYKKDRKYIGTETLPPDFTEKWMGNISKIQNKDFSIIVYENWKNTRTIWNEMEKYWKVRNMLIWHLPNRTQGFSAKYKFFSKYDFALVGTSPDYKKELNVDDEPNELFQNEYQTALYATSGKPHWEGYKKGGKYCPSDFIEFKADDAKASGQGVVFGTKPLEILIPYIKVLTKRGDVIVEPFGGSGSTLCAAYKLGRRCFIMEKCEIYAQVILARFEKLSGKKAIKIN